MTDAELASKIREQALLEGDFVLRSGKRSRSSTPIATA